MNELRETVALALEKAFNGLKTKDEIIQLLEKPPAQEMGDLSLPCFSLAKELKNSPQQIAGDLKEKIKSIKGIESIECKGPYLNFFFETKDYAKKAIESALKEKEKFGLNNELKNKKIMVEFLSPNTNKPLHLGHLRNMSLGESISRIYEASGAKVFRTQIINDRGAHICKSMLAYMNWGKGKTPEKAKKKSDHFIGEFYVMFSEKAKENSMLEIEAQQLLLKWENKDPKVRKLWKQMNSWALKGFKETTKRFDVKFDKEYFESDIYLKGKELIQEGLKKKIFTEQNGAIYIDLEKYNLPNKVVVRADGSSLYITQDIFLAKQKFEDFNLDESIYVVGSEQALYFQQLIQTLELMQYPWAKNMYHLSYGMVYLPDGKMKSREGTVVDADDLMDEIHKMALIEIKKRDKKISKNEAKKRAEIIALSAIKFYLLKVDAVKDIHFNPEESISFEGETGPYIQYTYARAKSILSKAIKPKKIDYSALSLPKEKELSSILNSFQDAVADSMNHKTPHKLCHYLLELSNSFNSYYHEVSVLKAEEKEKNARLALTEAVTITIHNGLKLLGIKTLEKM
ncbi:MAG: arginine--tRNA ligase [Candidatus Diapherotrites archaeon]|nr:arginine--tRNA ligase [Candidatus Diapherotrites archaeon]